MPTFQRPRRQTKCLPITLHLCLNAHHSLRRLQPADTHPPLYISSKHLVFQASNRLLERLSLTLKPPIPIDFGSERPIANLTYGFVYVVVPHVVSIEKPKYVASDRRGWNVDVDNRRGMNFAVIGGAVK
jgi:hypothetical protein